MSIKDLKKSDSKKPVVKDLPKVEEVKTRKADSEKLKHQAIIRFTDLELEELDKLGLVYNGKVDNKRLREYIIKQLND